MIKALIEDMSDEPFGVLLSSSGVVVVMEEGGVDGWREMRRARLESLCSLQQLCATAIYTRFNY